LSAYSDIGIHYCYYLLLLPQFKPKGLSPVRLRSLTSATTTATTILTRTTTTTAITTTTTTTTPLGRECPPWWPWHFFNITEIARSTLIGTLQLPSYYPLIGRPLIKAILPVVTTTIFESTGSLFVQVIDIEDIYYRTGAFFWVATYLEEEEEEEGVVIVVVYAYYSTEISTMAHLLDSCYCSCYYYSPHTDKGTTPCPVPTH